MSSQLFMNCPFQCTVTSSSPRNTRMFPSQLACSQYAESGQNATIIGRSP